MQVSTGQPFCTSGRQAAYQMLATRLNSAVIAAWSCITCVMSPKPKLPAGVANDAVTTAL